MRKWISFPRIEGNTSRQAHADLPPDTFEREMGKEGFFGPSTHFYHRHPPTGWSAFEGPLRPHAFDSTKMIHKGKSPWDQKPILRNDNSLVALWTCHKPMDHLVRNADGDLLLFIHSGRGSLFCDFGHLPIRDGDYIILPRGTMWRLSPWEEDSLALLMVEASGGHFQLPEKGILGANAIFDQATLDVPSIDQAFLAQQGEVESRVVVKARQQLSTITFPFNPLDATGWTGDNLVARINWRAIRPVMSHRYHLPPSAHTTFVGPGFVVATFTPRPLESDPGVLKVPFFHNNDDYDELIFYHRGNFFSRDNIHPGMLTLHPAGFTHGPHPKAFEAGRKRVRRETDEVAVMIDSRTPWDILPDAHAVELPEYVNSWKAR
ncbi:homogentisate 1,2-dioxygenase [Microbulbifer sp. 2205BS26-8]|uniref:homogentisate 1,2-dioxygenase n=1 Tax=Microbulbifer sp. 2205BS26-8 TaxID=3064386 RepID=UPI00273CF7C5|nr:homogentisate 1,2-dioxygenase [Microbulbifer sp. 2205BS26-8]MDP5210277.1 homogentisate 1,2-dioxygenase [Microbulbifer sp. 2205BS26-8]